MRDEAPPPSPTRRLTDAARARLNQLIAEGKPVAEAMRLVKSDPSAFEEYVPAPPAPPPERPPWKGDHDDWTAVREKIDRLRSLDQGRAVFGAARHRYELAPPLSDKQVGQLEKKWKITLPPGLRAFYTQVGNGGPGLGYGLFAAEATQRFQVSKPYPGVAALRQNLLEDRAPAAHPHVVDIRRSKLTGLIAVADMGCNILPAVVCTGDVGRVVTLDDSGLAETEQTLVELVAQSLDEQIAPIELVRDLHAQGASHEEMTRAAERLVPKQKTRASSLVDGALRSLGVASVKGVAVPVVIESPNGFILRARGTASDDAQ